jgi:hypothetical protein
VSSRKKFKGAADKAESGGFSRWPHSCASHPNYHRLSLPARALLTELLGQYRGNNNGDLCCAWRGLLKERGWRSRTTVDRARDELVALGWIVLTRQGDKNKPNLYALTFFDIDDCGGKLDAGTPIGQRLSYWKEGFNPNLQRRRKAA